MATNKGTRKRVPPSRERYAAENPVVSVRISKELREELQVLQTTAGMSIADVLRVGLDRAKLPVEMTYNIAYEDSRRKYEVPYWCSACGEMHLSIETDEEKEEAAMLMYEAGWHALDCRRSSG
jgi:hypothetical protein